MQTTIVRCVEGDLAPTEIGICDAHNHLWIEKQNGFSSGTPYLDNYLAIRAELIDYRQSGGQSIVDCQPSDCGRNGKKLRSLSRSSGVHVVACTGYHLKKYYPANHWLFNTDVDRARDFFLSEISLGLQESLGDPKPIRAGFIKVACQEHLAESPVTLLKAAAQAAIHTGVAVEVHTEKGSEAEKILDFLLAEGMKSNKIVLCHMDKRPDFSLHKELVTEGALLEYDTFYRPKYKPEMHLWKLIAEMVKAGLDNQLALATDMADASMWINFGQGPGLAGFPGNIKDHLLRIGIADKVVEGLLGANIAFRLAFNP
jgi:predicted metal-dependent phosphotriesterase family hydrolase